MRRPSHLPELLLPELAPIFYWLPRFRGAGPSASLDEPGEFTRCFADFTMKGVQPDCNGIDECA